jgi:hypothetical protein
MARTSKTVTRAEVVEVLEASPKAAPTLDTRPDPDWIRTKLDAAIARCIPTLTIDAHLFDLASAYLDAETYDAQKAARRDLERYTSHRIQDYAHSLRLGEAMPSTSASVRVGVKKGNPETIAIMATVKGRHGLFSRWEAEVTQWFTIETEKKP